MEDINCLGDMCPIPIMKLTSYLKTRNKEEPIKLTTDHSCVVESVTDFCRKNKMGLEVEEPMNGIWELFIS